jgi:TraM recognition site of TraD and TraG
MQPILIGHDAAGASVYLWPEDFLTHLHGIGATRTGKTRWLVHLCLELAFHGIGFILIDGKGEASEELIAALAYYLPPGQITYFDPSRTDWLIPYNPFKTGDISASVKITEKAWGEEGSGFKLGKWLPCIYALFKTGEFSFNEVLHLFEFEHQALREKAFALLTNPVHKSYWQELLQVETPKALKSQLEPVRNRLSLFMEKQQFRRIFYPEGRSLDFGEAFEKNQTVIANLQDKGEMTGENVRLLGMLMLDQICRASMRAGNRKKKDYFLLIDEAADFIIPDLRGILDKGAGKGMHLGVFHQTLGQLTRQDGWVYESIMSGARLKVIFGGISKPAALTLAGDIYTTQWEHTANLATFLARQPQRHFTLARPNKEALHLITPDVEYADLPDDYKDNLILKYFIKPYGLTVPEMDRRLAERRQQAIGGATATESSTNKAHLPKKPAPLGLDFEPTDPESDWQ